VIRGGAGKRKGNRSQHRSSSPAGRAWLKSQKAAGWWGTKTPQQILADIQAFKAIFSELSI